MSGNVSPARFELPPATAERDVDLLLAGLDDLLEHLLADHAWWSMTWLSTEPSA